MSSKKHSTPATGKQWQVAPDVPAPAPVPPPLRLRLPATSANLGPAFDAAGLAMALHLDIRARVAPVDHIIASGRDASICGLVPNNLILNTYRAVLDREQKPALPLELEIDNQIPIGKGCGSSAAARLAGVALAVHFGELDWDDQQIITEGALLEGHPDNIAPCWLGGLVISRLSPPEVAPPQVDMVRINHHFHGRLLLALPTAPLATEEARRVLPTLYSRADVTINIQNAMLMLAAFTEGRNELFASAFDDRIHQPYRAALCPLMPVLKPLAGEGGILGVALSGAGPSVLLLLDPLADAQAVIEDIAARLESFHQSAELVLTSIEEQGGNLSLCSGDAPQPDFPAFQPASQKEPS